jgi:MFS family permease
VYLVVAALGVVTFLLVLWLPVGKPLAAPATTPTEGRWRRFRQGIAEVAGNRYILTASSVEAAMFLGVGALVGFLPLYATRVVGLNDAHVGIILGGQLLTAMAGKPLTGRLSDRVGRKPLILVGLLMCAAMLPLAAMTTAFPLLIAEAVVFGLGMAIVTPATTALVTDLSKAGGYGAALGVFGTIWDIGEALGPILAGALIGAFAAMTNAYLPTFTVIAAVLVASAIAFSAVVQVPRQAATP